MEKMQDFVQKVRDLYDIKSDYGLAKALKISRNAISAHKHKRSKHFSEETAYKIAEMLNVDPAYVMACLAAERAKDERVRETWQRVSKMMRVGVIAIVVSIFVPMKPAEASTAVSISHNTNVVHIMRAFRRWLDKWAICSLLGFWYKSAPR